MNMRKAAEIAFGVMGVWLIVASIPGVVVTFMFPPPDEGRLRAFGFVQLALVLLCGLGLVYWRRALALWLAPNDEAAFSGSTSGLQAAAFSIIAVLFFTRGLRDLIAQLVVSGNSVGDEGAWKEFVAPVVQIAIGLGLFFGARRLVSLWHSLGPVPDPKEPSERSEQFR